jgi:hypothetical protein
MADRSTVTRIVTHAATKDVTTKIGESLPGNPRWVDVYRVEQISRGTTRKENPILTLSLSFDKQGCLTISDEWDWVLLDPQHVEILTAFLSGRQSEDSH